MYQSNAEGRLYVALFISFLLSLLNTHSTTEERTVMKHIEIQKQPIKIYRIQVAYSNIDSHGDKQFFEEPDIWEIDIPATNSIEAIVNSKKVIDVCRAETMTDIFTGVFDVNEKYTLNEIMDLINHAEHAGIYKSWLMMEPTSIQCTLKDDVEKLKDMTITNLSKSMSAVGDEAENYLKEIDNDNA